MLSEPLNSLDGVPRPEPDKRLIIRQPNNLGSDIKTAWNPVSFQLLVWHRNNSPTPTSSRHITMKFILAVAGSVHLALALPPSQPSYTISPPPDATAPARKSPAHCGGFAPQINICPEGLVCAPTQPPNTADFPGTCVLQPCGGKTASLDLCPIGQVCVYNATSPITDIPGRCMAAVLTCGGKEDSKCKSGWDCLLDPKIDAAYEDEFSGAGICIPPGSLVVNLPWEGWGA